MKLRIVIVILLTTILSISSTVNRKRPVYTLMELINVNTLYERLIESSISTFKRVFPDITEEVLELCRKEMESLDFLDTMANFYSSQFTEKEIMELIEFYSSPTGQKALTKIPILQKELITQLENYQEKIAKKCTPILQEKGYMR